MDDQFVKCSPPPYARLESDPVPLEAVLPSTSPQPTAPPQSQPIVVNPLVVGTSPMMQNFGPKQQIANCPYCHVQVRTRVKSKALGKAHCWACILFLIGFWPCICCPYCCCDCSKKHHYCGNCNAFLGTYNP